MIRPSRRMVVIGVAAAAVATAAPALALSGHANSGATATVGAVADSADSAGSAGGAGGFTGSASGHRLSLQAMPTGTVDFTRGTYGRPAAHIDVFGLTPGSAHRVEIDTPLRHIGLGTLTADATGRADSTLSAGFWGLLPDDSRLVLRPGTSGGTGEDGLAAEPIARTGELAELPFGHAYRLSSIDVTPHGTDLGTPGGHATFGYNAAAHTLTVTVTASGVTPGAHAAHIHDGSCMSQGPVAYMLMDFTADSHGRIDHETRTVTGVMSPPPASGWYLNLHQGTSSTILANGLPTLAFRPLLCANI